MVHATAQVHGNALPFEGIARRLQGANERAELIGPLAVALGRGGVVGLVAHLFGVKVGDLHEEILHLVFVGGSTPL